MQILRYLNVCKPGRKEKGWSEIPLTLKDPRVKSYLVVTMRLFEKPGRKGFDFAAQNIKSGLGFLIK